MKRSSFRIVTGIILIALACAGVKYYSSIGLKPIDKGQTKLLGRSQVSVNAPVKRAVSADRPAYASMQDLKSHAEAVIQGTVLKQIRTYNLSRDVQDPTKENTEFPVMGTDYEVCVDKYIKGSGASTIVVTQENTQDRTPMQIGAKYVLFLNNVSGKYMFGGEPFKFKLTGGKAQVDTNNKGTQDAFKTMSEQDFAAELQK
ncbi:MAG TPA: hypothetical protein VGK02_01070 [Candidatus Aquicultor sp.]|jgi:hypothetical protein